MPSFELQFPPADVEPLAARFGDTDDSPLLRVGSLALARGYYTRGEFLAVCAWKTPRSRPRIAANSRAAVVTATRRALGTADEAERYRSLLALHGVGGPTASTLLYFVQPDDYPILDVRALESLGVKSRSQYPVAFWLEYLSTCRRLALECGVSIRTLDKALWQYSKERSRESDRRGV